MKVISASYIEGEIIYICPVCRVTVRVKVKDISSVSKKHYMRCIIDTCDTKIDVDRYDQKYYYIVYWDEQNG